MKLKNGLTSSGCYGTFEGETVQLQSETPERGLMTLVYAGPDHPDSEWNHKFVYGAPKGHVYWERKVEASRVTKVHYVKTTGQLDKWRVNVVGEFGDYVEVRIGTHDHSPEDIDAVSEEFGLLNWERLMAYGWVKAGLVTDIRTEA